MMSDVKPAVNRGRAHPILFGPIMTGQFYQGSAATVDSWIPNTVDFLGSDPYQNESLWAASAGHATRKGMGWFAAEFGSSVDVNPSDATHKAHMQRCVAINNGLANKAFHIYWFDANHNLLDTTLNTAAGVSDTSIVVRTIPGKSSGPYSMTQGAVIIIDPHGGANAETRTLSATTTQSSSGAATLRFVGSPLAHAHPVGTPVWLMPDSVAYWRTLLS
jgi:hypothetical protein